MRVLLLSLLDTYPRVQYATRGAFLRAASAAWSRFGHTPRHRSHGGRRHGMLPLVAPWTALHIARYLAPFVGTLTVWM